MFISGVHLDVFGAQLLKIQVFQDVTMCRA